MSPTKAAAAQLADRAAAMADAAQSYDQGVTAVGVPAHVEVDRGSAATGKYSNRRDGQSPIQPAARLLQLAPRRARPNGVSSIVRSSRRHALISRSVAV
jgi:hypothetical protein